MVPMPFVVRERRRETADTWTLELEPRDGNGPFAFAPGQFNMLYAFGVGEIAVSISGDPTAPGRLVHTVRAVGAVSSAICRAEPGTQLGVRGPFGSSWPVGEAAGRYLVIVAGGLGLAPLRPALLDGLARRAELAGLVLLVGGRRPEELLFRAELDELARDSRLELGVTVDTATAGSGWSGHVGVVTGLLDTAPFDPAETVVLTCGPEVMMRFVARAMLERGVAGEDLHLSIERNMKCAVTHCGRCQLGPTFACREGPVMRHADIAPLLEVREL